jgi:hypothetical protein
MYDTTLLRLFEAQSLLLSSRPKKKVDAIFVHSRSHGADDEGLLELAACYCPYNAPVVVINGGDGTSLKDPAHKAWPGADNYEKRLKDLGVTAVARSEPAQHTGEECEKFAKVIKEHHLNRIMVINHPQHLLRTFLRWVKVLKDMKLETKLFPAAPHTISWDAIVNGTQGSPPKRRLLQCSDELDRVFGSETIQAYPEAYPEKFASLHELLEYLLKLQPAQ